MIKLLTIHRDTKIKLQILIVLIILFIGLTSLFYLDFINELFYKIGSALCVLVFTVLAWTKNYKICGHILLGEHSIEIFEKDNKIEEVLFDQHKIDSITIKQGIYVNSIYQIVNGFAYLPESTCSIEISIDSVLHKYDIELERTKMERKRFEMIFNKLEAIGIRTEITKKRLVNRINQKI